MHKTIYIFNIASIQNPNTGIRAKEIANKRKMMGNLTNVGSNTLWASATANITLVYQVEIQSNMYQMQKYVAFRDSGAVRIYEIVNTGKGSKSHLTKLNLKESLEKIDGVIEDV